MTLPTARLADVLAEAKPGFACGEDSLGGVFQFRMNNITTRGTLDLSKRRRVPRSVRRIDSYVLCPGDVLFNATNSPELVGKSAYFPGIDEPAVFSNHFLRLRPDPDRLDGRYFAHWLNVQFQRGVFGGMCRQWVNQATVGRESLLALRVPLPALVEQRRIAEVLDRAETLRAKRREALETLDELRRAIFVNLFGGGSHGPSGWPLVRLEEVLAQPLRNGLSPSNTGRVTAKVLTLSAITGKAFNPSAWKVSTFQVLPPREQSVDAADMLICRGNGNLSLVGKGHFPHASLPDITYPDTVIAARIDTSRVVPAFLEHVWNGNSIRRQIEAVARTTNGTYKVNQTMLEAITFSAPPLPLQREFAARVASIQRLSEMQCSSLSALDSLFASLQHRAFRGDL